MTPRRVALAAWELGAGRGHLEHLKPIVAALLKRGWTVLAAVRDLEAGRAVFGSLDAASRHRRFAVGQAPIFVHRPGPRAVLPSSLAEILAHEGFADPALLCPVIETWGRLIDAVKPSVVVADFAPSAVAAAHGRIPVVMTGNGWTIPPDGSPIAPLPISPYDAAAAAVAEARICNAVAEATTGRWRPDRFAQLLRGDAPFVFTTTLLDPYRASRRESVYWPPNLTIPSRAGTSDKTLAVAYLPPHLPGIGDILAALGQVGIETRAYCGGAQPSVPSNVRISTEPIDLASMLPLARCAVHHGGLGIASWCVVYGVPQVIVPPDLEKDLTAHAIEANGGGVRLPLRASCGDMSDAIRRAIRLKPSRPAFSSKTGPYITVRTVFDACEGAITPSSSRSCSSPREPLG